MPDKVQMPQPTAVKLPLPCFGDGYKARDPACGTCPHRSGCLTAMGNRLSYVRLSQARFQLVPADYNLVYEKTFIEDPEIADMQRTYIACYRTTFSKHPPDHATSQAESIARAAQRNDCSVRLYMLACMMGHAIHQGTLKKLAGRASAAPFRVKNLRGKIAENRAKMFRDICGKDYGAFSVSSLSTLSGVALDKNSPEARVLDSEIKAGQFIVDWKTRQGGPVYDALYSAMEATLDPLWLAIEDSYKIHVLDAHLERPRGSDTQKSHRFAVVQAIAYLKKHRQAACMAFQTREALMPKAISEVLRLFGYGADDFEIVNEPVTDVLNMWVTIGLAVQHDQCLRYLADEKSILFRS